jgi:hypothetical protein
MLQTLYQRSCPDLDRRQTAFTPSLVVGLKYGGEIVQCSGWMALCILS